MLMKAETECRKNKNYASVSVVIDKSPGMIY